MKILHISQRGNSRLYKQAITQQDYGWQPTVCCLETALPELHCLIHSQLGYSNPAALAAVASAYDVVVVHTSIGDVRNAELLGKALRGRSRLVWDCHDYVPGSELASLSYDAVTVPSRGYAKHFGDKARVVYSKVPKSLMPTIGGEREKAVVLMGTLEISEPWGDYSNLEYEPQLAGAPVYVLPSGGYEGHEHMNVLQRRPYQAMLSVLTRYEWSWCGSANRAVSIDACVTNKFWESLAAGCTIELRNSAEMAELLKLGSYHVRNNCVAEQELPMMERAYVGE